MKKRIFGGISGLILFLGIVYLGFKYKFIFDIFMSILIGISLFEILHTTGYMKSIIGLVLCIFYGMSVPFTLGGYFDGIMENVYYGSTGILFVVLLVMTVSNHKNVSFTDATFSAIMTWFVSFGFSLISILSNDKNGYGFYYFIIIFSSSWLCDTGAYFIGNFFGKHSLCPVISPKKTVEGFIGGIAAVEIFNIIFCILFNRFISAGETYSLLLIAVISPILAVASVYGDLIASQIKRSCGIKDYGKIIPGHGGIMDRFDSVLMTAPVLMFFVKILPLVTA